MIGVFVASHRFILTKNRRKAHCRRRHAEAWISIHVVGADSGFEQFIGAVALFGKKLAVLEPGETKDAILLISGEDLQPLAGVYRTRLAGRLTHYIETGNRMVFGFVNGLKFGTIYVQSNELKNVNRRDDLE